MAWGMVQVMPQPPQFVGSTWRLASQPSAGFLLQSPQPAEHGPALQAPAVHIGVACTAAHALPQPPQLATSLDVSMQLILQQLFPAPQRASSLQPGTHATTPPLV